jgi:hypothetical protein
VAHKRIDLVGIIMDGDEDIIDTSTVIALLYKTKTLTLDA